MSRVVYVVQSSDRSRCRRRKARRVAEKKQKRDARAVFWGRRGHMRASLEKPQTPVGKKVPVAKRASRPRTSSLRSESSLSLSRRFNASISCAASSAISNANASHYRANAPRASVSFPVVSCVPWIGKWQTVSYSAGRFLVRARGRGGAGGSRRRGRARGDGLTSSPRASRARSGRTLVRDPASRARARRRPSALPREALKTTTRTRANE